MENAADNKSLTPLQKIVLFAFVSFIVELPRFINYLIDLNTGLGEIKYTLVYFAFPFALNAIHRSYWKLLMKFPHLIPFLLMVLVFLLFQEFLSPSAEGALFNGYGHFLLPQIRIYIYFLMLINFGLNRIIFYKVIDYAFYSILLICLITYAGNLGFFEIGSNDVSVIKASLFEGYTPDHVLHVNRASYMFTFAILLLIIKQHNEKRFSKVYLFRDFTVILLFFGMMVINASRGALLISTVFIFYYIYFLWRYKIRDKYAKLLIFVFVVLVFALTIVRTINVNVLENYKSSEPKTALSREIQTSLKGEEGLRIINTRNSWQNFLDHPFTGVGYYNAAKIGYSGSRANNQYTQLLASYGIIFFIIYIFYNYKLVVFKFNLLKRPEVALCLVYQAMHLLFERPEVRVAILAYIAAFFCYSSRNTRAKE